MNFFHRFALLLLFLVFAWPQFADAQSESTSAQVMGAFVGTEVTRMQIDYSRAQILLIERRLQERADALKSARSALKLHLQARQRAQVAEENSQSAQLLATLLQNDARELKKLSIENQALRQTRQKLKTFLSWQSKTLEFAMRERDRFVFLAKKEVEEHEEQVRQEKTRLAALKRAKNRALEREKLRLAQVKPIRRRPRIAALPDSQVHIRRRVDVPKSKILSRPMVKAPAIAKVPTKAVATKQRVAKAPKNVKVRVFAKIPPKVAPPEKHTLRVPKRALIVRSPRMAPKRTVPIAKAPVMPPRPRRPSSVERSRLVEQPLKKRPLRRIRIVDREVVPQKILKRVTSQTFVPKKRGQRKIVVARIESDNHPVRRRVTRKIPTAAQVRDVAIPIKNAPRLAPRVAVSEHGPELAPRVGLD